MAYNNGRTYMKKKTTAVKVKRPRVTVKKKTAKVSRKKG